VLLVGVAVAPAQAVKPGNGDGTAYKQCRDDGWQFVYSTTGAPMLSETYCREYIRAGSPLTSFPNGAASCFAFGGDWESTLVVEGSTAQWTCVYSVTDSTDYASKWQELSTDCLDDGLAAERSPSDGTSLTGLTATSTCFFSTNRISQYLNGSNFCLLHGGSFTWTRYLRDVGGSWTCTYTVADEADFATKSADFNLACLFDGNHLGFAANGASNLSGLTATSTCTIGTVPTAPA
jgi:hypothetical protein